MNVGRERRGCMVARLLPVCSKLVFMSVFVRGVDISRAEFSVVVCDATKHVAEVEGDRCSISCSCIIQDTWSTS